MSASATNPSAILQTAFSFWSSKVLLTAVEFGVFTKLANRKLTGAELGAELKLHPRANADFFDALVAMKFLERDGDGPAAKYFNTPEGALFLAAKYVAAAGLNERVGTAKGNFFQDPLPRADVITMGMVLHDWSLEKKMHLIRAAYDALPSGGALVVIESLIDDARRENVQGLLMSLNMLIEFGDAFDYSGADFRKWCGEVGFKRFDVIHLAGPSSAAVAYK